MPATEFYDTIFVDKNDTIYPAGPLNISENQRSEALAVQVHVLILQGGKAIATGSNTSDKHGDSWFGNTEKKEGSFDYNEPAEAYGLAVLVGKGQYERNGSEAYIPIFETIHWSKTVRLERIDGEVTTKTYADQQAAARLKAAPLPPPKG